MVHTFSDSCSCALLLTTACSWSWHWLCYWIPAWYLLTKSWLWTMATFMTTQLQSQCYCHQSMIIHEAYHIGSFGSKVHTFSKKDEMRDPLESALHSSQHHMDCKIRESITRIEPVLDQNYRSYVSCVFFFSSNRLKKWIQNCHCLNFCLTLNNGDGDCWPVAPLFRSFIYSSSIPNFDCETIWAWLSLWLYFFFFILYPN